MIWENGNPMDDGARDATPAETPSPQGARGERKRCQIIDGAREIFLASGFEGASIDDIARTAGVSKATLYRHFPDKIALFAAVLGQECAAQARHYPEICRGDRPLDELVLELARGHLGYLVTPFAQRIYRIAVAESDRFPDIGRSFFASGPGRNHKHLAPILAAAAAHGELTAPDPDLAAFVFLQICSAEIMHKQLFSIDVDVSPAALDARARAVASTFLTAYRYVPSAADTQGPTDQPE